MPCYKDMTFCSFYKDCKNGGLCKRALTEQIKQNAEKWSREIIKTNDILICQYVNKPLCFKEKNDKNR